MPVGRLISRAACLRGMLAALAGPAASRLGAIPAAAAQPAAGDSGAGVGLSPLDLDFAIVARIRPFDLLPPRFVEFHERVPADAAPRGAGPALLLSQAGPVAPYAAVLLTLDSGEGRSGAPVVAGLASDGRNGVIASFDRAGGTVGIDAVTDGRTVRLASGPTTLDGATARATQVAFVLNENVVTALVETAAGWTPVVQTRVADRLDFRDPTVLGRHRYGYGGFGIAEVRAGYFGQAGLRDLHAVSYADGTPCIRDNKLYVTATQAGLSFFQAAHWGVWTLDLDDPGRIEPVAKLFFARDGLVLGDHAGQIVIDGRGGADVLVSSWGDFAFKGVHVRHGRASADILHGVHVLETQRLPLPTDVGAWDPSLVRVDGRWAVGFVESPFQDPAKGFDFHPALARGGVGAPLTRLERVGADTSRHKTEGAILQKIGGRWYLMASDGAERRYRVYDLSMRLLGFLRAPYGSNIPHPQIVPVSRDGRTSYLLLTFDGTPFHEERLGYGTHGEVIVMRAAQVRQGLEFTPWRE